MAERRFEVGDEVVVAKALGKLNGRVGDDYFYGGNIRLIPLGSVAEVRAIVYNLNEPYCQLFFPELKLNWSLYVGELEFADEIKTLEKKLPGFKEIGKHPLFEMAEQTKIFLLNKKIYSVNEADEMKGLAENYFKERGKAKKSLVELGNLSFLEELLMTRYGEGITKTNEIYAQEVKKDMKIDQMLDDQLTVPQLIFKYVFPHLRKADYEDKINKLFGDYESDKKEDDAEKFVLEKKQKLNSLADTLLKQISAKIEKVKSEKLREAAKYNREKFIDELLLGSRKFPEEKQFSDGLEDKNIAIIGDKVYDLVFDSNGVGSALNVEEKNYVLSPSSLSLERLEKSYKFNLAKKIKMDVLKNYFTKEKLLESLECVENDNLKATFLAGKFEGKDSYSEEDFGFVKHNDNYYVYLDVPEFAVHSAYDDNYYFFDKTKVALQVYKNHSSLHHNGMLVVTKNNNNPLFHRNVQDFMPFCIGSNTLPSVGKDIGEVIAKMLRKGKDIMLYGYLKPRLHCDELREVCSCGGSHFKKNIKTLAELRKKGIEILQGKMNELTLR